MQNGDVENFWWEEDEGSAHDTLFPYVQSVEENQQNIHTQNMWHAKLYSNRLVGAMDWGSWGVGAAAASRPLAPVRYNVCQNVTDTATAMIGRNQVRPVTMTDGASFKMRRRAKKQDAFLLGVFQGEGYWKKAAMAFRDACIFGTGFLKVSEDEGKICIERIFPDEIIVDEAECVSTDRPTQIHHRKVVDKETLKALWPEHKKEIDDAASANETYVSYRSPLPRHVIVIESWILPMGDREGRHVICVENATLLDEPWDEPDFPIVWVKYTEPVAGFYGQGLVEQIAGIQLQINKLNNHIDKAMHLNSVPRVLVPVSSGVKREHITNALDGVIPYKGGIPPSLWVGNAVHPEIFRRLDDLVSAAFNFAGVSQMRAQGKKEPGLDSGKAIREFTGVQDDRFAINVLDMETMALRVAETVLMVAKRAFADKENSVDTYAAWRDRDVVKQIKWSEVNYEDERPVMRVEAANIMSKTPSGRQADVADLIRSGYVEPEEAKRLLAHPDLDRWQNLQQSNWDDAEATIDRILDGEIVDAPEDFQDLNLHLQLANRTYLQVHSMQDVPDEVLFGLIDYMGLIQAKIETIQALEQQRQMEQMQQQMQMQVAMQQQVQQPMAAAKLQEAQIKAGEGLQRAQIGADAQQKVAAISALGSDRPSQE